jgi:holin-like protein
MIGALTLLILCQLTGEVAARAAALPVPGPVLGLLLLLTILVLRRTPSKELRSTAGFLLRNMGLLFVPAGVGVVTQLDVLRHNIAPVAIAILVSTALGLGTTAWVMQRLTRGRT